MFIWPKEVIFNASEYYLLPPNIVGGGKDSKILNTNPRVIPVFQSIDKKIRMIDRLTWTFCYVVWIG